jgi:hypothetical protein
MLFAPSCSCFIPLGLKYFLSFILPSPNAVTAARSKAWSSAAAFLGLRVRIPPGTRMSVSRESRVLSDSAIADPQQRGRLGPLGLSGHEKGTIILFSNSLNLCTSRYVKDQSSHRNKTTEKIIVLSILILIPLDRNGDNKRSISKCIIYFPGEKIDL